jgi:MFS superfamily sulfate permease-like transporter
VRSPVTPQAGRIAGTPVVTGFYTVLLPLVGFAIFGSSRHLVVAADSATAAIFSGSLSAYGGAGQRRLDLSASSALVARCGGVAGSVSLNRTGEKPDVRRYPKAAPRRGDPR